MYDTIIIGCGFAGAVIGRELAENDKKVLIIEQRGHIGGNCYDIEDEHGILVHQYGPHIFHTNSKVVYDYLSRFTEWYDYRHEVVGNVNGEFLPIPFNLNTLELVYGKEKAKELEEMLIDEFGIGVKIPILQLRKHEKQEIRDIADFVYENVFLKYTMKQWGQKPEEIDPQVSGRVPVLLSRDNRYFQDTYQGMPKDGYTKLFENLLDHPNIDIRLHTSAKELLVIEDNKVYYEGHEFKGNVVFTGPVDELFDCEYGRLPYRSLHFAFEYYEQEYFQSHGVVNYTVSEDYTRITEFKRLTGQECEGTTIIKEYPRVYSGKNGEIPYYAILNEENQNLYEKYTAKVKEIPNFYLLGRLAEYKYYNMDGIVEKALELAKQLGA